MHEAIYRVMRMPPKLAKDSIESRQIVGAIFAAKYFNKTNEFLFGQNSNDASFTVGHAGPCTLAATRSENRTTVTVSKGNGANAVFVIENNETMNQSRIERNWSRASNIVLDLSSSDKNINSRLRIEKRNGQIFEITAKKDASGTELNCKIQDQTLDSSRTIDLQEFDQLFQNDVTEFRKSEAYEKFVDAENAIADKARPLPLNVTSTGQYNKLIQATQKGVRK